MSNAGIRSGSASISHDVSKLALVRKVGFEELLDRWLRRSIPYFQPPPPSRCPGPRFRRSA